MLHEQDELDLLALVNAIPRSILGGIQELELAFPIAQDMRLEIRDLTDLPDGKKLLDRLGAHSSCSARRSRAISSGTACLAGCPSKRMRYTIVAIGIST